MATTYAVHTYSHWQGSTNPGRRIATLPKRDAAEKLVDRLSTCSFCNPGRSGNYQVGDCYRVYRSQRSVTADKADDAMMQMRDADAR